MIVQQILQSVAGNIGH